MEDSSVRRRELPSVTEAEARGSSTKRERRFDHDLLGERGSRAMSTWFPARRGTRYMTPFLMGAAGPTGPALLASRRGGGTWWTTCNGGCAVVPNSNTTALGRAAAVEGLG